MNKLLVLHNPLIKEDDTMDAGQKVFWDCVWFGNYPQTEIKQTDVEYVSLQNVESWDNNVINGTKYHRMLKGDAAYSKSGSSMYYSWVDDEAKRCKSSAKAMGLCSITSAGYKGNC